MSLTYGTVLTEGYNWPQHSVGLVNVRPIPPLHSSAVQHRGEAHLQPYTLQSSFIPTDTTLTK
jgi:hypothetical protein